MHVTQLDTRSTFDQLLIKSQLNINWDVDRVSIKIATECQLQVDWGIDRHSTTDVDCWQSVFLS